MDSLQIRLPPFWLLGMVLLTPKLMAVRYLSPKRRLIKSQMLLVVIVINTQVRYWDNFLFFAFMLEVGKDVRSIQIYNSHCKYTMLTQVQPCEVLYLDSFRHLMELIFNGFFFISIADIVLHFHGVRMCWTAWCSYVKKGNFFTLGCSQSLEHQNTFCVVIFGMLYGVSEQKNNLHWTSLLPGK